jgi:hypothetical protein
MRELGEGTEWEREGQEKLTLVFFLQIEHWAHVGNWCKDNCADI